MGKPRVVELVLRLLGRSRQVAAEPPLQAATAVSAHRPPEKQHRRVPRSTKAVVKLISSPPCTHHWVIDVTGKGVCKSCGGARTFQAQRPTADTWQVFSHRPGLVTPNRVITARHLVGNAYEGDRQIGAGRTRPVPQTTRRLQALFRQSGLKDVQLARRAHIPVRVVRRILRGDVRHRKEAAALIKYLSQKAVK